MAGKREVRMVVLETFKIIFVKIFSYSRLLWPSKFLVLTAGCAKFMIVSNLKPKLI